MLTLCCLWTMMIAPAAGAPPVFDRPKLIATGWDQPNQAQLLRFGDAMDALPFAGAVVSITVTDPGTSAGEARTFRPFRKTFSADAWDRAWFEPAAKDLAAFAARPGRRLTDNFLPINANPGDVDWFDDAGWAQITDHFRHAGHVVRAGKLKGIAFDAEPYDKPHFAFRYASQPGRLDHTFAEYAAKARERGRAAMSAMLSETTDFTVLTYFLGSYARDPLAAREPHGALESSDYGLYIAFVDGWLDVLPPSVRIIDGDESSYLYNTDNAFAEDASMVKARSHRLFSPENRDKFRRCVGVGFGLYMDAYVNPPGDTYYIDEKGLPRVDRLLANATSALRHSDSYVWVYGETHRWWPKEGTWSSWDDALPGASAALAFAADPASAAWTLLPRARELGPNLARKGDFASAACCEPATGPDVWNTWRAADSTGAFAWDGGVGCGAHGSLRMSGVTSGAWSQRIDLAPAALSPGMSVLLAARIRHEGRGVPTLILGWKDANNQWMPDRTTLFTDDRLTSVDGWQTAAGWATIPVGAAKAVVMSAITDQLEPADRAWFDDVEVYAMPALGERSPAPAQTPPPPGAGPSGGNGIR